VANIFNTARLALARRRRGMTKRELAEALGGITAKALGDFEGGMYSPDESRMDALARVLGFPVEFFYRDDPECLSDESVSFRSMASMKAGQREAALAAGEIALELAEWIGKQFDLPSVNVPDMRGATPEAAADAVRAAWGLGEKPVKSMIHLLEAHGVRVFSLSEKNDEVDAFSFWRGGTPYCFLNTMKSAEHSRMDGAHELGHLVLHRHGPPSGRDAENEANEFASAFLMPRAQTLATAPRTPTLPACISHKHIFGTSVMAYVRRLHTLGMISDWHYRSLCIQITKLGYRRSEPEPAPHESSKMLTKVFDALRAGGMSKADVARALNIYSADLDALVFGLVVTSVPGDGMKSPPRGALKLV